jgi:5-oxoprolinase (ATP-hydrolysing)
MIEVWCDVGGTFTDCFVVLENQERRSIKVLSSGIVKGRIDQVEEPTSIIDANRMSPCDGFWNGATFHWLDRDGKRVWASRCSAHDSVKGQLRLEQEIPKELQKDAKSRFCHYELESGFEAPVIATRLLLQIPLSAVLPSLVVRLGTTRGTNALLTRRGAKVALITTRGFRDILRIGYQERPDLFTLNIKKREPLYERVVEIDERMSAAGATLVPIDEQQVREAVLLLRKENFESLAIAFLHGYRYPKHEQVVESIARELGFQEISRGSHLAPFIKIVSRTETTVVDAYLGPVVRDYLETVALQFGGKTQLSVMTSGGGLVDYRSYAGKDSVLSGPAGGAVALTKIAEAAGCQQVIGLDMGGTSTDVCRIDGGPTIEYEAIKAGVRLVTPMLAIHTVAAGGGSICSFDGVQWHVGPQSAGADPGPACYGRGGPLTITDLNLLTGRILSSAFPFALDIEASRNALCQLLDTAMIEASEANVMRIAEGLRRIANEHMVAAVRKISIAQGADPRTHALIGFGGAAGQHICEIADILNIDMILDVPEAGLLSALGMGLANISRWSSAGFYRLLHDIPLNDLEQAFRRLETDGLAELQSETQSRSDFAIHRWIEMRYAKTDQPIAISYPGFPDLAESFHRVHRERFGYERRTLSVEVVGLRVEVTLPATTKLAPIETVRQRHFTRAVLDEAAREEQGVPRSNHAHNLNGLWVRRRDELAPGEAIVGPGIVLTDGSTLFVTSNWTLEVLSDRTLKLRRNKIPIAKNISSSTAQTVSLSSVTFSNRESLERLAGSNELGLKSVKPTAPLGSTSFDPMLRDILAQRIAAIADSMGVALEQTAMSVNIKERRDFSCAVFNRNGELLANAPHVPVHLGSMGETVKQILIEFPMMKPGDCFITNDPYRGGSHLPDVTVITPVFSDSGERLFFTANRAHHAEIGGLAPGSMSPLTQCLEEEGVIVAPTYLTKEGISCDEQLSRTFLTAKYPTRAWKENLADIAAQQAANRRGELMLKDLAVEYASLDLDDYLEKILLASETKVRRWIESIGEGEKSFVDRMDDGTKVCVKLQFTGTELQVDFEGTGSVSKGNFNANPAIVRAAVLYVVRVMIDDDLPLNSGALRPITIIIPPGLLNPKQEGLPLGEQPAVAAGNVETSQRVVDCLLGALGVAGASQGTMNNLLMGNQNFGYYETIGGGSGATMAASGSDAVHTHMTNTRLTDPEILESRYPVRLTRFEVRSGSGGKGARKGGEGIHRELLLLEDLDVSLVTSRRGNPPYGAAGGEPGASGENYRIDDFGSVTSLPAVCQIRVAAGERIGIKTPGGGGYGIPSNG